MGDVVEWLRGLDPRTRADQAERLLASVSTGALPGGSGLSALLELLGAWTTASHPRVVLSGLAALRCVCERRGDGLRTHVLEVLPLLRDLLTDSSDAVRDELLAILSLCMAADRPGPVFEHLAPALAHRAWRVRHTVLMAAELMFTQYGSRGCLWFALGGGMVGFFFPPFFLL